MDPSSLWIFFPIGIILALALAAFGGAIIGYPTLRARGDYLAIMTLAFGEIVRIVAINWIDLTGGSAGIRGIPPFAIGSIRLNSPEATYWIILAMTMLLLLGISALIISPIGRAWVAIREDELVASSIGITTKHYKLLAYVCGASIAGVTGVFFAHMQQFINPDSFTLEDNFIVLSLVILGGSGTFWGPAVGAVLWIFFEAIARDWPLIQVHPELSRGVLALVVIVLMIVRPGGIVEKRLRLSPKLSTVEETKEFVVRDDGVAPGERVLDVHNLTQTFGGITALKDVTFDVKHGEILGLIGPNGAGKSTLLNALSGLTNPDSGMIDFLGTTLQHSNAVKVSGTGIARTFQTVRLFWDMTVMENLLTGAHDRVKASPFTVLLHRSVTRRRERAAVVDAHAVLKLVGLENSEARVARTLDFGAQRRVEIARALMTQPKLLLLDEPAAGMNELETHELAALIHEIRARGVDIVLIEHDMDLLMSVSDSVVVLNHGEVIARGTPEQVMSNNAVREAYLGGVSV